MKALEIRQTFVPLKIVEISDRLFKSKFKKDDGVKARSEYVASQFTSMAELLDWWTGEVEKDEEKAIAIKSVLETRYKMRFRSKVQNS